ncbi:MAG: hypothetical protein Q8N47_25905 [Bryobacterales bacterium]|nr:hypothetical protein [Bryobacterales bacterium]
MIELDREVDGRWIAEVPELNILLYGKTRRDAVGKAESAAAEIIADRIAHGELPPISRDRLRNPAHESLKRHRRPTRSSEVT